MYVYVYVFVYMCVYKCKYNYKIISILNVLIQVNGPCQGIDFTLSIEYSSFSDNTQLFSI